MPSRRASERPMATACLRLVTFLPLRPDLSLPRFMACISRFTSLPADGEYLRDDFFAEDFLCEEDVLLREVLFLCELALLRALDFLLELDLRELDFFALDFFVAITILR